MYAYPVEVVLVMVFCEYNEHCTTSVEQNRLTGIKDNYSVFQKHHPPLYIHRINHSTHAHYCKQGVILRIILKLILQIIRQMIPAELLRNYKNAGNDN